MALLGNADIVKTLLAAGASLEVYDEDGITPLIRAIYTYRNDIMKMLVNSGANVNSLADHDYSALHHAAWNGNAEVVQLLLDNGARDDDRTDDGNTPLALAAHGECDDTLQLLIHRGCCINNSDKSVLVKLFWGHREIYLVWLLYIPLRMSPFLDDREVIQKFCAKL